MSPRWDPRQGHDVIRRRDQDKAMDSLKEFLVRRLNRQQAALEAQRLRLVVLEEQLRSRR